MAKVVKNTAFFFGILILSGFVFYLASQRGQFQEDFLERSLSLLRDQLLASLPNNQDKDVVAEKWQVFSEKAIKGEIPAQRVEKIAIGVLNASNSGQELSVEDADVILSLVNGNLESSNGANVYATEQTVPCSVEDHDHSSEDCREANKQLCTEFAKELVVVCEFNDKMKTKLQHKAVKIANHLKYKIENGIKVEVDKSLRDNLFTKEFQPLSKEIQRLHATEMLEWRDNFINELNRDRISLKSRLDSLRVALNRETIIPVKELERLERLREWQVLRVEEAEKLVLEVVKKSAKHN